MDPGYHHQRCDDAGKKGYEVCAFLKRDQRTSHIPIILLTAKARPEDRFAGLREGADAYLVKPFEKKELFIRLEQLVALRKKLQAYYTSDSYFSNSKLPTDPANPDEVFLQKLIGLVQSRIDDTDLAVADLCAAANLSNMQVNRKLKALTGRTPSGFIRFVRLQKASELLKTTSLNISEIAYATGFSSPNYFSRVFSEAYGYPPSDLRQ